MARMRGSSSRTQFWFDGLVLSGQTVGSGLLEQGSRLVNLVKKKAVSLGVWPPSGVTVRCCLVKQLALVMNSVILRIWLVFPGGVTVGLGL